MLEFNAIIQKQDGIDGAYVEVPFDVEKEFGAKRVKVKANFDGLEYIGSVVRMSDCYLVGITKEIRMKIGKIPGDTINVRLVKDEDERVIEINEDLRDVISNNELAMINYANLSYTEQKEINKWIESAKKEDTKILRIGKTVENLMKIR